MALTVAANTPATAAQYNALIPVFIQKASDEIVNASTVMQNDNDFTFALAAGTTYVIDLYLHITGAEAADFRSDWATNGTASVVARHVLGAALTMTDVLDTNVNMAAQAALTDSLTGVDAAGISSLRENLVATGGASGGSVFFRWAQNVSTGSDTTVKGTTSYLIAHRVV